MWDRFRESTLFDMLCFLWCWLGAVAITLSVGFVIFAGVVWFFPFHQYEVVTASGKVYRTGSPVLDNHGAPGFKFQDEEGNWVYVSENAELRDLGPFKMGWWNHKPGRRDR